MFTQKVYEHRIKQLQKKLDPKTIYLVSKPSHITYFTGFQLLVTNEREAFFACTKDSATLIYTSFSPIDNFETITYLPGTFPEQLKSNICTLITQTPSERLIYDPQTLYVSELDALMEIKNLEINPKQQDLAQELVILKDPEEIELMRTACHISTVVFETVLSQLQVGMTELSVSQLIEETFRKNGITQLAFPTIVAFGSSGAKPHHQPSDKKLELNTAVLIDMGGKYQGYCADMSRSFWFGDTPQKKFLEIEKIVQEAYELALQTVKNNKKTVRAKDIDNAARVHISNQGFGETFIHTTGHGLGLEIHESPSLSWHNNQEILPGMTITIEPGIYLLDEFGYRHENTVLVTESGYEILTQ